MKVPSRRFMRFYRYPQALFPRALFPVNGRSEHAWNPRVDVRREDGRVIYSVDIDEAKPEDLTVMADDGVVTIKGKRQLQRSIEREGYNWRETSRSSFSRSLPLERGAVWEKTEASYENGVLEVTVPVVEEAPTYIEIQSDAGELPEE
jgi:HSP20 family protein